MTDGPTKPAGPIRVSPDSSEPLVDPDAGRLFSGWRSLTDTMCQNLLDKFMPETSPDLWHALQRLPMVIPDLFVSDLLRYVLAIAAFYLVCRVIFRRSTQSRKIRTDSPGWAQKRREIRASLRSILVFTLAGSVTMVSIFMGTTQLYVGAGDLGWIWFAVSIGLMIVLHDAWFYWTHRLIHHPRLFRRFHREHHKSSNPSPWTAYAFNLGEAAINALFVPIILHLMPVSILAATIWSMHQILRNVMGHSGYELFPATQAGKPMFDWMTTVTHHDLHHAQAGYNYGLYFTWWDRLMGTEHPDYHARFQQVVDQGRSVETTGFAE